MKQLVIVLTGGLGNQLFQIQYAMNLKQLTGCKIFFDVTLGQPRGVNGVPDSFYFGIPGEIMKSNKTWLAMKTSNSLLRSGYSPSTLESRFLTRKVISFVASVLLSIHYRRLVHASSPNNLGFDQRYTPKGRRVLVVGYFQSYRYSLHGVTPLTLMRNPLYHGDKLVEKFRQEAANEKPVVIHVRRGDYKTEESFGLLGPKYYEESIKYLSKLGKVGKIWLFSDEPNEALQMIPAEYHGLTRLIPEVNNSPALTLEVMRMGSNYIIANSTFSWWAAYSAHSAEAHIVAPNTWFKTLPTPSELLPEKWVKVNSFFL